MFRKVEKDLAQALAALDACPEAFIFPRIYLSASFMARDEIKRVAEELTFNEVSTGAQNDLQRATDIAERMVKEYGMSGRLGVRTFERERRPLFLGGGTGLGLPPERTYGEETATAIDAEIQRILEEAHARVRTILTEGNGRLGAVAKALLEKEVLAGEELTTLLAPDSSKHEVLRGAAVPADAREG